MSEEPVDMNSSDSSEEYFSADDEENIKATKGTSRRSLQGSGKGRKADSESTSSQPSVDRTKAESGVQEVPLEPHHEEMEDPQAFPPTVPTVPGTETARAHPEPEPHNSTLTTATTAAGSSQQLLLRVRTPPFAEGPVSPPEPQSEEAPPKPPPRTKKRKRDQGEERATASSKRDQDEERTAAPTNRVPTRRTQGGPTDAAAVGAVSARGDGVDTPIEDGKRGLLCAQPVAAQEGSPPISVPAASATSSSIPAISVTSTTTTTTTTSPTRPPKPPRKHQLQSGISIEQDIQLELTEDMICSSDVVTVDTMLAKASGEEAESNMSAVFLPSDDDESTDGESLIVANSSLASTNTVTEGGAANSGHASIRDSIGSTSTVVAPEDVGPPSPSDTQILQMTMVKNLDTGELIPLSAAEERIPRGWSNPLAEHLKQRNNELEGSSVIGQQEDAGDVAEKRKPPITKKLKKIFKWKEEEQQGFSEDENEEHLKYKPSSHHKGPYEFDKVRLKQDLSGQHLGAVWVMEFSICGKLLATAGQDSVVRVWVLRTAYPFFHELQIRYQRMGVHSSVDSISEKTSVASTSSSKSSEEDDPNNTKPFLDHPLCSYYGHTADVLGMSWSKNFFILSSSMDKTVRLWHISRKECLCCFQHVDFVTSIAFHPRDDRYFLSGSLDGKLRLWNIPDKKVALWNEIDGTGSHLITAANFCANGKFAVVGTYDGRCIFYDTEHLKYHTQIHVRSRHGKNKGRKISGVEPLPGENKVLVTSNDSRIRLYNLVDHSLSCKYKGGINCNSQIKATFSRDGQYIISGSEDKYIYIWKTHNDVTKLPSTRRDRSEHYESFSCHSAPVTAAIFAPVPGISVDEGLREVGQMIVAADYQGSIKVYVTGEVL